MKNRILSERNVAHLRWYFAMAVLLSLYLLVRLAGLDTYITWDERQWLAQSGNFYSAIVNWDLDRTFQTSHPGVTTMWVGVLGYLVALPELGHEFITNALGAWLPGADNQEIHDRIRVLGSEPLDALVTLRVVKILTQGVLFTVAIHVIRTIFGRAVALVAGLMLALEPFVIAHDQIFAIDGLFAIACLLAVLLLSKAVMSDSLQTMPWIIAGAAAALTWLTRLSGVAILGTLALTVIWLIAVEASQGKPLLFRVRQWARPVAIWLMSAAFVTLVMWPAWVVSPIGTAKRVLNNLLSIGAFEGKHTGTFFMGSASPDPGPLFYPAIIIWRTTPLTLAGVAILLVLLATGVVASRLEAAGRRCLGIAGMFLFVYGVGMSLGSSKSDRYMDVVIVFMCFLSAIGIVLLAQELVARRKGQYAFAASAGVIGLVVVIQLMMVLSVSPYYVSFFNPMLGGAEAAQDVVPVGWGEGGFDAAEFILGDARRRRPELESPIVVRGPGNATWLVTYALPDAFVGDNEPIESLADWQTTDYYLVSIEDWQKRSGNAIDEYVMGFTPDHTIVVEGVEMFWAYYLGDIPPPAWLQS